MEQVQISEEQLRMMKHALGLNKGKEQTRNYFYTSSTHEEWNDLVRRGLAMKRSGWDDDNSYYFVTEEGKALIIE